VFLIAYAFLPRYLPERHVTTLIYVGINAVLAIGLNLLMGYAGQISLGHAAFYGLGAYTSAILIARPVPADVIPGLSAGIGVIAGTVTYLSLTRTTGARVLGFIGLLIAVPAVCIRLNAGPGGILLVASALGTLYSASVRTGWPGGLLAGLIAGAVTAFTGHGLGRVLEAGSASPWAAMAAGVLVSGTIAYLVGAQILRLKGHYLAMATLGFGVIVEIIFRQWTAVTGGSSDGIFGIPPLDPFASSPVVSRAASWFAGGELTSQTGYYYLVWAFVFAALVLGVNIVHSRVGRAFRAVHGSEIAAESLGVDTSRYKVQVFVLSAALASIAGSLHAQQAGVGYVNPSEFGFAVSVQLVVMVVVGGMASVWGALFGAAAIQLLRTWLLEIEKTETVLYGITLQGLEPIVFGAILILIMIAMPQGLVRGLTDAVASSLRLGRASERGKAA